MIRVRVNKLKYVVLEPVYQIVRLLGWSLCEQPSSKQPASSSRQQASKLAPRGPFRAPVQQGFKNWEIVLPRYPGRRDAHFELLMILFLSSSKTGQNGTPRAGNREIVEIGKSQKSGNRELAESGNLQIQKFGNRGEIGTPEIRNRKSGKSEIGKIGEPEIPLPLA